jgi:hypothetical protein
MSTHEGCRSVQGRTGQRGGCAWCTWSRGDVVDGRQPVSARGLVRAAEQNQCADAGCGRGRRWVAVPLDGRCRGGGVGAVRIFYQAVVVGGGVCCWRLRVCVWLVFAARRAQAHSPVGVRACAASDPRSPGDGGLSRPRCRRGIAGGLHACCCRVCAILHDFSFLFLLT